VECKWEEEKRRRGEEENNELSDQVSAKTTCKLPESFF
jgi:hypothetical protein